MTVADLREKLCLRSAYRDMKINKIINGCYTGDYLSIAMKGAKQGNIWLTVVNNPNIVAVAMLKKISCIIICENVKPTAETVNAATDKDIPILLSDKTAYQLAVEISRVI